MERQTLSSHAVNLYTMSFTSAQRAITLENGKKIAGLSGLYVVADIMAELCRSCQLG